MFCAAGPLRRELFGEFCIVRQGNLQDLLDCRRIGKASFRHNLASSEMFDANGKTFVPVCSFAECFVRREGGDGG